MTRARLWTRLVRLEEQASHLYCYAEGAAEVQAWLAQAGVQAALAPEVLQQLCAAVQHSLEALAQQVSTPLCERRDPGGCRTGHDDGAAVNHPGRGPRAEHPRGAA